MKYFGIRKFEEPVIVTESVLYFGPAVLDHLAKNGPWKWKGRVEFHPSDDESTTCSFSKTTIMIRVCLKNKPLGLRIVLEKLHPLSTRLTFQVVKNFHLLSTALSALGEAVQPKVAITLPWSNLDVPAIYSIDVLNVPTVASKQVKNAVIQERLEIALSEELYDFIQHSSANIDSGVKHSSWKDLNGLILCMPVGQSDLKFHMPVLYFPAACRGRRFVGNLPCDYDLIYAALKEVAIVLTAKKEANQAKQQELFDGLMTD